MLKAILSLLLFLVLLPANLMAQAMRLREKTLHVDRPSVNVKGPWSRISNDSRQNIKYLIDFLAQSPTGKDLLLKAKEKAQDRGEGLTDVLLPGKGSLTDTTLLRRFSASDPLNVRFETRSRVYINEELPVIDAVLDMAHELTHFIYRRPFNPYRNDFSLMSFIQSTVEAEGGEVHAYLTECQVLSELFPKNLQSHYHCSLVISDDGKSFSREKGIKEFYKVGKYYKDFLKTLAPYLKDAPLPKLSEQEPLFISSAYGKPYPVAAYEEYFSVLTRACENDRKRLGHLEQSATIEKDRSGRSLASIEESYTQTYIQNYKDRCEKLPVDQT